MKNSTSYLKLASQPDWFIFDHLNSILREEIDREFFIISGTVLHRAVVILLEKK